MKSGYVYHLSHTHTPPHDLPQLFITGILDDVSADQLRGVLMAHYSFGESEPPEANYIVDIGLEDTLAEVQRGWRSSDGKTVSYAALMQQQPD